MVDYRIKCEVARIKGDEECCPGSAQMKRGDVFILGVRTPEPNGMCARTYASIYPTSMALRFSEEMPWEKGRGYVEIVCPDGLVTYRLSRITDQ
jgi:uncharacterized repeat protein (TIGR04076 family)